MVYSLVDSVCSCVE